MGLSERRRKEEEEEEEEEEVFLRRGPPIITRRGAPHMCISFSWYVFLWISVNERLCARANRSLETFPQSASMSATNSKSESD